MNPMNGKLPERIIRAITRRPMLTSSALSLSFRFGKDAYGLKKGKIARAEFVRRGGGHVAGTGLGALGMFAGVFLSPIPILGGFLGAALGETLGERLGRGVVQRIQDAMGIEEAAPSAAAAAATAGVHAGYAGAAAYEKATRPRKKNGDA